MPTYRIQICPEHRNYERGYRWRVHKGTFWRRIGLLAGWEPTKEEARLAAQLEIERDVYDSGQCSTYFIER